MIKDIPHMAQAQPFEIKVKSVNLSYHVEDVFNIDLPALQHGNDGLIYTCAETPYIPGTDHNILKWKPPSENSIDFKLILRFPPATKKSAQPDFHAKPVFELHVYCGDERGVPRYEFYDVLYVDDDEWERLVFCNPEMPLVRNSDRTFLFQDESFRRTIRRAYRRGTLGSSARTLAFDAFPR